ncbi:MAG: hypothetical protein A3H28_03080 [Acidobacteria bacterium RIFCSPLOWO2_02_FULL_61_28]|nr:MAG: hypothetical protein A3H28_03080 [Acidobacteria bacterium RIFCSPLOWO2_02_FULL_61_28]
METITTPTTVSLYRGDCLDVLPQLPKASVDLILADLPYGTTACAWDCPIPLDRLWAAYARVMKPTTMIVLTAMQPFAALLIMSKIGWFRYEWIWEKPQGTNPLNAKMMPLRAHEHILVFGSERGLYQPQMEVGFRPVRGFVSERKVKVAQSLFDDDEATELITAGNTSGEVYGLPTSMHRENAEGTRYPTTVLRVAPDRKTWHPTQKPEALMRYLVRTYTKPGDLVLDNAMGSGTTGVAAVIENRAFVGIEQDRKYFRRAAERIQSSAHLFSEDLEFDVHE